jgi:hypothetical protein
MVGDRRFALNLRSLGCRNLSAADVARTLSLPALHSCRARFSKIPLALPPTAALYKVGHASACRRAAARHLRVAGTTIPQREVTGQLCRRRLSDCITVTRTAGIRRRQGCGRCRHTCPRHVEVTGQSMPRRPVMQALLASFARLRLDKLKHVPPTSAPATSSVIETQGRRVRGNFTSP